MPDLIFLFRFAGVLGPVAVAAVRGRSDVAGRPAGELHAGRGAGLPRAAPVRRVQGGPEDVQGVQLPEAAQVPGAAPETVPGHALVQEDHVAGVVPGVVAGHVAVRVELGARHTAAQHAVRALRRVQPLGHAHRRPLHRVLQAPGRGRVELLQRRLRVPRHVAHETHQQRGVHTVLRGSQLTLPVRVCPT